jgi:hypothetical protein
MAAFGRYCCKSRSALLIKNSLGCRRDFRVKMWGTSSPDGKLTGDLGNAIESTEIDGCRSRRPLAGKLSSGDFRLLQQYRPIATHAARVEAKGAVFGTARVPQPAEPKTARSRVFLST